MNSMPKEGMIGPSRHFERNCGNKKCNSKCHIRYETKFSIKSAYINISKHTTGKSTWCMSFLCSAFYYCNVEIVEQL